MGTAPRLTAEPRLSCAVLGGDADAHSGLRAARGASLSLIAARGPEAGVSVPIAPLFLTRWCREPLPLLAPPAKRHPVIPAEYEFGHTLDS